MYVTPIRLDLLVNTNQISCCKGKWYVRLFDLDNQSKKHSVWDITASMR